MLVTLKRKFIAGKFRYKVAAKGSYTKMPDSLRGHLPPSAVIYEGPDKAPEGETPPDQAGISALRAADPQRAMSESSGEDALKAAGMAGLAEVDQTEEEGAPEKKETASDKRAAKAQAANRAAKRASKKAARKVRAEKALAKRAEKSDEAPAKGEEKSDEAPAKGEEKSDEAPANGELVDAPE